MHAWRGTVLGSQACRLTPSLCPCARVVLRGVLLAEKLQNGDGEFTDGHCLFRVQPACCDKRVAL